MKYIFLIASILTYSHLSLAQQNSCANKITSQRALDLEKFVKRSVRPKEGKEYRQKVLQKIEPILQTLSVECARAHKKEKFPVRIDAYLEIDSAGDHKIEFDSANVVLCECIAKGFPSFKELGAPPSTAFFMQLGITLEPPNKRSR